MSYGIVQGYSPKRNVFDLSYWKVFDCDIGNVIPILFEEVLPGDIWKVGNQVIVKMPLLNRPVFQEFMTVVRYFGVENRVLDLVFQQVSGGSGIWLKNTASLEYSETPWEHFITGGKTGDDLMTERKVSAGGSEVFYKHSLLDYVGVDPALASLTNTQLGTLNLALRKITAPYNAIYNTFFRNENFQAERQVSNGTIFQVNWQKDRFTSALAEQQRGVAPSIDFSNDVGFFDNDENFHNLFTFLFHSPETNSFASAYYRNNFIPGRDSKDLTPSVNKSIVDNASEYMIGGLGSKDLFLNDPIQTANAYGYKLQTRSLSASSFNVSDLRLMFQTQKFLELNERAGYRYGEQLKARFNESPRDWRLDRPLYLGATKQPFTISQVTATGTAEDLGKFQGQAISANINKGVVYRAREHGWIIGLMYVIPKAIYGQRIDPQFFVKTRYDYYTPEFAHISEQPIKNREIYPMSAASNGATGADGVFGYQGAFDEYRSKMPMVCGNFRGSGNLADWTCQRYFSELPSLSTSSFFQVPTFRNLFVSSVQSDPPLQVFAQNFCTVWRKMPKYATPGNIDHA